MFDRTPGRGERISRPSAAASRARAVPLVFLHVVVTIQSTMSGVRDARFARLHTDPRFQRMAKKERSAVIDSRFDAMQKDSSFDDRSKVIDKRGHTQGMKAKTKKHKSSVEERTGTDGPISTATFAATATPSIHARSQFPSTAAMDETEGLGGKPLDEDGEVGEDASGDESSMTESASSDDEESNDVDENESALVDWLEQQGQVPRVKDGTRRLAVCHCNWDAVRAVDLLAVLRSFVPAGGSLHRVAVYATEFGEQRMAEEATVGPSGILKSRKDHTAVGAHQEAGNRDDETTNPEALNENLRRYELERLDYYHAVATFDSIATAERVYAECDGAEFEATSLPLDLRFIPEDRVFAKTPRDVADTLPPDYMAPSFMCSALQQSRPTLSWDQDDAERVATTRRDLSKAEIKEIDYAAYLASDDEHSDSDGVEEYTFMGPKPPQRNQRKAALGELLRPVRDDQRSGANGSAPEISFAADSGTLHEKLSAPSVEIDQESGKRKRRNGRHGSRGQQSVDIEHSDGIDDAANPYGDDLFIPKSARHSAAKATHAEDVELSDTPPAETRKERNYKGKASGAAEQGKEITKARRHRKGKQQADTVPSDRENATLEMLLMGDSSTERAATQRGFDIKDLELKAGVALGEAPRSGGKKKKRGKQEAQEAVTPTDSFTLDTSDSRFTSIYSSSDYAIDPTDPRFRRTLGSDALLEQAQREHAARSGLLDDGVARSNKSARVRHSPEADADVVGSSGRVRGGDDAGQSDAHDLWRLVSSVKASSMKKRSKAGKSTGRASGSVQ